MATRERNLPPILIASNRTMTQQYILVCSSCENRISIEISQAGRTIQCVRCNGSIKIGTLRDIRALESTSISAPEEIKSQPVSWSPTNRALFVLGLVLLVVCGISGVYSLWKSGSINTERPNTQVTESFKQRVEAFSPTAMMSNWEKIDVSGIEVWAEPAYLKNRQNFRIQQMWGWGGLICAGIGVCLITLAFLMRNRSNPGRQL